MDCAKRTNGRACADERYIGLGGYDPAIRAAVTRVVALMPEAMSAYGTWLRLRDALAERLARSCARAGVRRLSLYSFRHAALATWKAAGLAPEVAVSDVDEDARHGWDAREGLPEPDPELVALIAAGPAPAQETAVHQLKSDPSVSSDETMDARMLVSQSGEAAVDLGEDEMVPRSSCPDVHEEVADVADAEDEGRTGDHALLGEERRPDDEDLFAPFPMPAPARARPEPPQSSAIELFKLFHEGPILTGQPARRIGDSAPDEARVETTTQYSRTPPYRP